MTARNRALLLPGNSKDSPRTEPSRREAAIENAEGKISLASKVKGLKFSSELKMFTVEEEKVFAKLNLEGYQTTYKDIFDAAENGRVRDVACFIKKGVDCNVKDKNGWTPLHFAADQSVFDDSGQHGILEFLIAIGANVNAKDDSGLTPLDALDASFATHMGCAGCASIGCLPLLLFGLIPMMTNPRKKGRSILIAAGGKSGKELMHPSTYQT